MLGLGVVPFDTCTVVLRSKRASRLLCFKKFLFSFTGKHAGAGTAQVAFFLLGTINNLSYVIVNSSAKVLATR